MGISGVTLEKSFDFFHDDEFTKLWGRLFTCTYDGKFTLDPEEVESGKFMTVQVSLCRPFLRPNSQAVLAVIKPGNCGCWLCSSCTHSVAVAPQPFYS